VRIGAVEMSPGTSTKCTDNVTPKRRLVVDRMLLGTSVMSLMIWEWSAKCHSNRATRHGAIIVIP
jgi:hypothetical protein